MGSIFAMVSLPYSSVKVHVADNCLKMYWASCWLTWSCRSESQITLLGLHLLFAQQLFIWIIQAIAKPDQKLVKTNNKI